MAKSRGWSTFRTAGQGIPFIALEGEGKDSKFRLTDEAKEFLQTLKVMLHPIRASMGSADKRWI